MLNNLGYTKNLFILPFDHRTSFIKLFGFKNTSLTLQEKNAIISTKWIIYDAFKLALSKGIPKEEAAILVDEQFGDNILRDAVKQGFIVLLTTEKSGQKEFTFEYNGEFPKHIEKYRPTFVKALVRYNPEDDERSKIRQQRNLKILSDYCYSNGYKFLLEVLIPRPSTSEESFGHLRGDYNESAQEKYDKEVRPRLAVKVIKELQKAKVEPDVWKLEGSESEKEYQEIVNQAQKGNRKSVGIVILGRGETQEKIEKWVSTGAKVKGVIGFAVGRTVFWRPLVDLKNGKILKEEAIAQIANNFKYFYDVFMKGKIKI